jgi:tetratricopeptide (TPR) repeat protein
MIESSSRSASSLGQQDPAVVEASADLRFEAGALPEALALQRQALSLHVERGSRADQARCHQVIGYLCFLLRDYAAAEQAYRQSIRIRQETNDLHGTAAGWGRLAEVFQQVGDHPRALQAFDESLACLRQCGSLKDLGVVLNNMAVSHREIGQREQALRCHERALEIRRDLGDHDGLAATLHNMGVLHADVGAHAVAMQALEQARGLREELGDKSGLAGTELRIGILHEQQGEHAQAVACYERAIELAEGTPDGTDNLAAALCNIGGLLVAVGEFPRALQTLERARGLIQGSTETPATSYVEYNLGVARIAQGNLQEGLADLAVAERIQRRCGDVRHLSATLSAKAAVEARRGEFANAEALLREALEIQDRLGEHEAKVHTLRLLAQCKAWQGQDLAGQGYLAQAEMLSMLVGAPHATEAGVHAADEPRTSNPVVEDARRLLQ